jgi:DNA-binding transcriptional ArsR family regulator
MIDVTAIGRAISDPTRLRLLEEALRHPGVSIGELARAVGYSVSTVSVHISVLRAASLLETRRRGRRTVVLARHDRWRLIRDACASFSFRG